MVTLLTIVHIVVCLFLILVVLLQAGKGGGMGIAFGGAGSQTVFGSSGAGNFLTRLTSITAALFLLTSLALAHYSSRQDSKRLQDLASQRATEKKSDDEKAAKLKADLEKNRPATAAKDGGAASISVDGAAAMGTPAPVGTTTLTLPAPSTHPLSVPTKLELTKPLAPETRPAGTVTKPTEADATKASATPGTTTPEGAPVAPKRPMRVKPKPAAAPAPTGAPSEAPAPTAPPSEPAAPQAP